MGSTKTDGSNATPCCVLRCRLRLRFTIRCSHSPHCVVPSSWTSSNHIRPQFLWTSRTQDFQCPSENSTKIKYNNCLEANSSCVTSYEIIITSDTKCALETCFANIYRTKSLLNLDKENVTKLKRNQDLCSALVIVNDNGQYRIELHVQLELASMATET